MAWLRLARLRLAQVDLAMLLRKGVNLMGEETWLTFRVISKDLHLTQIWVARRLGAIYTSFAIRIRQHASCHGVTHAIRWVFDR